MGHRGWGLPQTEFGLQVQPATVTARTCMWVAGRAGRELTEKSPRSGVLACQCMCKVSNEMNIGRSTYLQCPKSLSGSVRQPQSHLQDRVRRPLGGNIAGKSRKYKAGGGLPMQLLRAREGLTFIAALLHEPNSCNRTMRGWLLVVPFC